ncbi:PREDICTED: cyclin-dependent kinase inhibitor 5-like [Fragaria vesca subsp. vesca]|uniref:cyclin-dependent kinase inhibitor 5-like n=1 Tax=Fragaria vesca subsp. vesca TaxID=101020 RepID=UPI0002C305B4|nr:PREDICTED: cyclin-dependent kinase inhibitor 5-like [Fragaria vesca subsp. vesca]
MGKYMRKSKPAGHVAVMEVSQAGVRTRAKTLALQRSSSSYLQLRSRRLEKPPILVPKRHHNKHHHTPKQQQPSAAEPSPTKPEDGGEELSPPKEEEQKKNSELNDGGEDGGAEEASFGENVLEFEGRERTTRESTPCSLIRDPDTIRTPGSTTRPTNSADTNRRIQNSSQRHIPTAHDMDEFFAGAEEEQQKQFIDKYNFDPVNDKPLPGRYEWEKLDP